MRKLLRLCLVPFVLAQMCWEIVLDPEKLWEDMQ
jgi:hypothetical protein